VTNDTIAADVFQHLQKATAGDPAELAGLYREYLGEARQVLAQLRGALARKDSKHFCDRAHYLRGSSLILGATMIAQCCAHLERMDRSTEFRGARRLLDQTSAALAVLEAELTRRLGPAVVPVEGSAA
jgi:HPt (histidine-containing phosphotransfer) domain-containing protein